MTTIELQCPTCQEMLVLDAGFAGGVCRCSGCGTLMTVPAAAGGTSERLSRPATPGGRPEAPGMAASPSAPSSASSAKTPVHAPRRDHETVQPPSAVRPTVVTAHTNEAGKQTFVTASGRTLELDADAVIPTAAKKQRPVVRATTAIVAVGALLVLVVVTVLVFVWVIKEKTSVDPHTGQPRIGYDVADNPLVNADGRFLYWSLDEPTVIVLDAAGLNRPWLEEMKDVLVDAAAKMPEATPLQVVALTDLGVKTFPDKLRSWKPGDTAKLRAFLTPIPAMRFPDPVAGLETVLKADPRRIILVTGQQLTDRQVDDIDLLLDKHPDTRLSVALLGTHLPRLQTLVNKSGGKYVSMPQEDFLGWYAKIRNATQEPRTK